MAQRAQRKGPTTLTASVACEPLGLELGQRIVDPDAGVVDQAVEPAPARLDGVEELADLVRIGDVAAEGRVRRVRDPRAARCSTAAAFGVARQILDEHRGAGLREQAAARGADAAAAPRHHDPAPGEIDQAAGLDHHRDPLPAADAGRGDAPAAAAPVELLEQGDQQAGAASRPADGRGRWRRR